MTGHKSHIGYSLENDTWFVRVYGFETEDGAKAYQASLAPSPAELSMGIEAAWRQYTTDRKPSIWGREVFEAGFRAALSSPMGGSR